MINWEEIREEFEKTEITMKLLAEKHDIKATTLRSRKNREKWKKRNETKSVATKNATQHKNVAMKKAVEKIQGNTDLTEKQKLFCLYFSQFNNATKAYQKAYECSYETAASSAYRMLENVGIRNEIKRLKEARSNDWLVDVNDIINEWIKMAFSDLSDYVEFKGHIVKLKPAKEVDGRIIKEIKSSQFGTTIKLYDKQRALIELNKLIGGENILLLQQMEAELELGQAQLFRVKAENGDFDYEVLEDDGFMNAIKGMVTKKEVWPDED